MTSRHTRKFLPFIGHWSPTIGVNQDGSGVAVYHIAGHHADLAGVHANMTRHISYNAMLHGLTDPAVEMWCHLVRRDGQEMTRLPVINNWFANRFDEAHARVQGGNLFRNDLFVTFVMHRPPRFRDLLWKQKDDMPEITNAMIEGFDDLLSRAEAGLTRFGVRRLGLREKNGITFSEITEAFHLIANGRFRPIGVVNGRMGRLIVPDRVVFGDRAYHLMGDGPPVFGSILSIKDYPPRTNAMMFTALRHVRFPITVTSALRFRRRADAVVAIDRRTNQMKSSNDAGSATQLRKLGDDLDEVANGESDYVLHQYSIAIRAGTIEDLDRHVSTVTNLLSDAGLTAIREDTALEPAFYGQIPVNRRWWTRPAPIKSKNAIAFAPLHDVPRGHHKGRWGAPIIMLRTTADTEYAFHFHVQGSAQIAAEDLGNCLLIGPSSSGKSTLLGTLCLLVLRVPTARVVIIDKDYGLSSMVRAADGSYLVLQSGSPSGLAPLRGLSDSAGDMAFLTLFIRGLIMADGQGELSNDEDERLKRAVSRQMEMPAAMRGFTGVSVMLGQRDKNGAAARLRRWCRGERLGWAFDNESDDLCMDARLIGFDTTALLRDELICSPTLSYLFYRTRKLINGQPIVLAVDEFWQTDRVAAFRDENNDQLKTIRKNEGVVILATQSARDALNSPNAHTFNQQIPTKIFFGDETANHHDLVDEIGLSEAEFLAVTRQLPNMKHAFLMKRPGGSVLCRFDLSGMKDMVSVVSGRRATFDLSERLIARYGADPENWVPHYERQAPGIADEPTIKLLEAAE